MKKIKGEEDSFNSLKIALINVIVFIVSNLIIMYDPYHDPILGVCQACCRTIFLYDIFK